MAARLPIEPAIDAVCCWGPRHGPAVLLNPDGKHLKTPRGERATLAHEIGHLLVDRQTALPLAEVLGGRTPARAEARARAFAAELLLPREQAERELRRASSPQEAVAAMRDRYGASSEVVAWQVGSSGVSLSEDEHLYLRCLVSDPGRFVGSRR